MRSKRQGKNTIGRERVKAVTGCSLKFMETNGEITRPFSPFFGFVCFFFVLLAYVAAESKGASKYTEDDDLELAKV